jgi:dihydroxyacetone kinase-like protein
MATMEENKVASPWLKPAIARVAETVIAHAEELTALDSAIGDGDHGHNMKRGFTAVLDQLDDIAALSPGEALKKIGMTMVTKVGGASGPLYGSLFLDAGKALDGAIDVDAIADAAQAGVAAVMRRGKSTTGEKTMLDVWVPVVEALKEGGAPAAVAERARAAAQAGLDATRDMKATKGRAAYLGERSVGHLDPGARSSALIVGTLADLADGALR